MILDPINQSKFLEEDIWPRMVGVTTENLWLWITQYSNSTFDRDNHECSLFE